MNKAISGVPIPAGTQAHIDAMAHMGYKPIYKFNWGSHCWDKTTSYRKSKEQIELLAESKRRGFFRPLSLNQFGSNLNRLNVISGVG